ncbi:MAG: MarR family transcriptional regulator [Bosea sp.]|uniref:MarR family winged helix-turn-helix transcriptional regulator n=1 Tax=unclassified Bosea (in: a-proteobacteria) TaxID=2653178 RepID=UPI00095FEFDA|nr:MULTISPECIES: MarR family transcriptional regulator [unclassified Bosea (in: a-proteobacteria)]MBN9458388.1 MarR family transcriptional regulator [Bosea sp. (in: a-proteobacteria)]OJV06900.1 MAG: MarR family transcriptional regulator [Bosea sp. 67-29]
MASERAKDMIGRTIARAARLWRRAVDIRLQAYGLTEATWLPLLHLSRAAEPMRQKDLAASLNLDGSTVARLLDGLQAAALIERREDETDRRAKTIHLTPEAGQLVAQVEAISREVRLATILDIPDADIERTAAVLERICSALATLTESDVA